MDFSLNDIFILIVSFLLAYLLGSIPTSVWIGKLFYQTDLREHGSGNAGATNTFRVLGWKAGIPVLLFDSFKGWAAVSLGMILTGSSGEKDSLLWIAIICGILATVGHIFPVFAGFRGGKGVATLFGVVMAIAPIATLICMVIFIVSLLSTRYVSLSSVLAGLSFPLVVIGFINSPSIILIIFSILVGVALIVTHRKNIRRLLRGEEAKIKIGNGSK